MVSVFQKLKLYVTNTVLPYASWNFGNSTMNTEGVKLLCEKHIWYVVHL